jgi:hypothetical protein
VSQYISDSDWKISFSQTLQSVFARRDELVKLNFKHEKMSQAPPTPALDLSALAEEADASLLAVQTQAAGLRARADELASRSQILECAAADLARASERFGAAADALNGKYVKGEQLIERPGPESWKLPLDILVEVARASCEEDQKASAIELLLTSKELFKAGYHVILADLTVGPAFKIPRRCRARLFCQNDLAEIDCLRVLWLDSASHFAE